MKTESFEVIVHKANIPLDNDESIGEYTNALGRAVGEHCKKKLNVSSEGGCWPVELYSNMAIVAAYDKDKDTRYYAVSYERSEDKEFEFGDLKEVKRITAYQYVDDKPTLVRKASSKKWSIVSKPFPNEHAARQEDPKQYASFARSKPTGFPDGISVIWGIKTVGGKRKSEIQSLRFDGKKWTPTDAKKWLKDHGFKTALETATNIKKSMAPNGWEYVSRLWTNII